MKATPATINVPKQIPKTSPRGRVVYNSAELWREFRKTVDVSGAFPVAAWMAYARAYRAEVGSTDPTDSACRQMIRSLRKPGGEVVRVSQGQYVLAAPVTMRSKPPAATAPAAPKPEAVPAAPVPEVAPATSVDVAPEPAVPLEDPNPVPNITYVDEPEPPAATRFVDELPGTVAQPTTALELVELLLESAEVSAVRQAALGDVRGRYAVAADFRVDDDVHIALTPHPEDPKLYTLYVRRSSRT